VFGGARLCSAQGFENDSILLDHFLMLIDQNVLYKNRQYARLKPLSFPIAQDIHERIGSSLIGVAKQRIRSMPLGPNGSGISGDPDRIAAIETRPIGSSRRAVLHAQPESHRDSVSYAWFVFECARDSQGLP